MNRVRKSCNHTYQYGTILSLLLLISITASHAQSIQSTDSPPSDISNLARQNQPAPQGTLYVSQKTLTLTVGETATIKIFVKNPGLDRLSVTHEPTDWGEMTSVLQMGNSIALEYTLTATDKTLGTHPVRFNLNTTGSDSPIQSEIVEVTIIPQSPLSPAMFAAKTIGRNTGMELQQCDPNVYTDAIQVLDDEFGHDLLNGGTDFDNPNDRKLVLKWDIHDVQVTGWHVYVREDIYGYFYLGYQHSTLQSFSWPSNPTVPARWIDGPEFGRDYAFRVYGMLENGSSVLLTQDEPVSMRLNGSSSPEIPPLQIPSPAIDPGTLLVTDDLFDVKDLSGETDTDTKKSKALFLRWNIIGDFWTYHVYVSINGGQAVFLGQTGSGSINYFRWSDRQLFSTANEFLDGPQDGNHYLFTVFGLDPNGQTQVTAKNPVSFILISGEKDSDGDKIPDIEDNCPCHGNADQLDNDNDGFGNACEPLAVQGRVDDWEYHFVGNLEEITKQCSEWLNLVAITDEAVRNDAILVIVGNTSIIFASGQPISQAEAFEIIISLANDRGFTGTENAFYASGSILGNSFLFEGSYDSIFDQSRQWLKQQNITTTTEVSIKGYFNGARSYVNDAGWTDLEISKLIQANAWSRL